MTIFDQLISNITNGLIADVQTAVLGLLAISLLVFGIQILIERFLGHSIETELQYREYKKRRLKDEYFERRYNSDSNNSSGPFTRL